MTVARLRAVFAGSSAAFARLPTSVRPLPIAFESLLSTLGSLRASFVRSWTTSAHLGERGARSSTGEAHPPMISAQASMSYADVVGTLARSLTGFASLAPSFAFPSTPMACPLESTARSSIRELRSMTTAAQSLGSEATLIVSRSAFVRGLRLLARKRWLLVDWPGWVDRGRSLLIGWPTKRTGNPRSFVTEREEGVTKEVSRPRKRTSLVVGGGLELEANRAVVEGDAIGHLPNAPKRHRPGLGAFAFGNAVALRF
jgi:hypothetical protein